jgi:recombinational DNA repair protein (RecF pathway)
MFETEIIILRVVNYNEDSLILHCLSPDKGRLDLMAYGARKISKKKFPQIGLFRTLSIFAKEPASGNLNYLTKYDLLSVNDHLALSPTLLEFSAAMANFTLTSSVEGINCPLYYNNLIECFANINSSKLPRSAWTCRLFATFLMEQGLFPEVELSPHQKNTLNSIIHNNSQLIQDLDFKDFQWTQLKDWVIKMVEYAGIILPQPHSF